MLTNPEPTSGDWQFNHDPDLVKYDSIGGGELSPDGNTLFYRRLHVNTSDEPSGPWALTQCHLLARDLGTDREREVYRRPDGGFFCFAVSPDGQHVAVGGQTTFEILPTSGGEPRELLKIDGLSSRRDFVGRTMAWTPDGRYLLFVKDEWENPELWRIAAAGGQPERIDALPPGFNTWLYLRIHPDGRQIAFSKMSWWKARELWVLENFLPDLALPLTLTGTDDPKRPFGLAVEVPDPAGDDVKEFAAQVKLSGDDDDWNAPQWCDNIHQGKRGSLDGLWESRGSNRGTTAHVKTVGDWVYILNNPGRYELVKARRQGNRLVGRYINVEDPSSDSGPWVGLIVNDERIDGVYKWKDTSESYRWDFRRDLLPSIELTSPASDNYIAVGEPVLLKADVAITQDATVRRVEFLIDGAPVGEVTDPPYQFNWDRAKKGCYSAAAKVYDSAGGTERSLPVEVFVGIRAIKRSVARSEDDAEQPYDAQMYSDGLGLELGTYGKIDQLVAIRFGEIGIPKGTVIKEAYLQFTTDEVSTEQTNMVIHAELAANAQPFSDMARNITSRRKTTTSVKWSPEPWNAVGERAERQQTPDLSALIQEVVAQPDWQEGNAVVLIISGSGERDAASYDGGARQYAPMLHIEY